MKSKLIIIIGCGRLGASLANQLSAEGHRVVAVDHNEVKFDNLSAEFSGFRVVGNAVELHTLREAKVEQADCLFATATEDNINLMVAQVARKIFNVPRVVARVYDPARERIYSDFGVETISPTRLTASAFLGVLGDLIEEKP